MSKESPEEQKSKQVSHFLANTRPKAEFMIQTKEDLLSIKSLKKALDTSAIAIPQDCEEPKPLPKIPQSKGEKANHKEEDFQVQQKLGMAIRQLREANQWTQHELAILSDIHKSYFTDIERGLYGLSVGKISRIAKALDVSMARLFEIAGL